MPSEWVKTKMPATFGCALLVIVCSALVCAQSPTVAPTSSSAVSVEHTRVLNLTVLDERGQPVTELTDTDFKIFDDGKLQSIASFNTLLTGGSAKNQKSTILILFDLLNTIPGQRENTTTLIAQALQPLETGDSLFLYLLTNQGELYPVHAVSIPTGTAVPYGDSRDGKPPDVPWTRQVRPLLDQAVEKVNARRLKDYQDEGTRTAATFLALNQLGSALSRIQGPKTIVWITRGAANWVDYPYGCKDAFFPDGSGYYVAGRCGNDCTRSPGVSKCMDYTPFLQRFGTTLTRSDTIVYSVIVNPEFSALSGDRGRPRDTLQQLTGLSGGRLYIHGEIEKAIAQSLLDVRARYQLTYGGPKANGKYHKLMVECSRKGVQVEAPTGYFAEKP